MNYRLFNIGLYLATITALFDQVSKWWVVEAYLTPVPFYRVTDFFNLRLGMNKGVTFGLFNELAPFMPYILTAVAVAIVLLLLNWLRKADTLITALALGLVMGGAVGNVIDRLHYGAVVDFLDFHYGDYHWYTFNLADSAIVCGVFLLLLENLFSKRQKL